MTVLLLFSSLTHFLQGSGQRTGMAIAGAWFCTPCPIFVVFEVCVWIIVRLEDPNMAHNKISKIYKSVTYWFFYLLLFDRIHDAMCLNKMSRTSSRNIGPQHQKYSSIYHGILFIPMFTKPISSVCCEKYIFLVSPDYRSQSHLKFQSCLITEYAGVCFWMS